MNLDEIGDYVGKTVPKYALISTNGTILKATMDENAILKIFPIISELLHDLPVGHMYIKTPVIIFRVTENILVLLLTQMNETTIARMLDQFTAQYGIFLKQQYSILPKNLRDIAKFTIFSMARQAGPEPIAWISDSGPMKEESIFKFSLSSMMLLMNEVEGARQRILSFHPFINERLMGMIYLFQVPCQKARGGAFDSAILIMSSYDERAVLYQYHGQLERIFSIAADDLIKEFHANFVDDVQNQVNQPIREKFEGILGDLLKRLQTFSIGFKTTTLFKHEMVESIKKLSKQI